MTTDPELAKPLKRIPVSDLVLADGAPAQGAPLHPVIVTLRRRPDRWQKIVGDLARIGITRTTRFFAVDGATLCEDTLAGLVDEACEVSHSPTSHTQLTRPAIGCFLSHLTIWKRFLEGSNERLVILEDDAVPSPTYTALRAQELLASIPPEADLVLLGCTIMAGLAEKTASERLSRVYYFNGTYAYLITRKGCSNLLPHLVPMRAHIDHQISAALVKHRDRLFAYAATPGLFDHDFSSWSDAYVPLAASEQADRHLHALLTSARDSLRTDHRLAGGED